MADQNNDIKRKLLEVFRLESQEHLGAIANGLIELEKSTPDTYPVLFERLFRAAHNFKGASGAVDQAAVGAICQAIESVIAAWKEGRLSPDKHQFDALHGSLDTINILLDQQITSESDPRVGQAVSRLTDLLHRRPSRSHPGQAEPQPTAPRQETNVSEPKGSPPLPPADPLLGMVRISSDRLDLLLREAEEMLSVRMAMDGGIDRMKDAARQLMSWKSELRDLERHMPARLAATAREQGNASLPDTMSEWIEWNETRIRSLQETINDALASLREQTTSFATMAHRHLEHMKDASLLPFSTLTGTVRKTARDLLRRQGKEADLEISGDDIEIDRRILQELKAPLLHLVRNAIDHGLEKPEVRARANKSHSGQIRIHLQRMDNARFQITVADDGAGIDVQQVGRSAVRKRIITEDAHAEMSRREACNLIFRSGVSSRQDVSAISGRGIGMAIVREVLERLSGQVWVESEPGHGTTFRLVLPSTISTLRALRIRLRDRHFMLPTAFVVQALRTAPAMVQTVENRETIQFEGETVALMDLGTLLQLGPARKLNETGKHTLILQSSGKRVALLVDEILDEQEVLVKSLGPQLERVRMISGGTVMGDGEVVPILNISDLLGLERWARAGRPSQEEARPVSGARKQILVVEDSITSRTLLKSILESSGYSAKTAIDGAEGFALLKSEPFDLVISDVDMPRMNGFELTRKIRADRNLADLPVILVTALESQRDRESGIDAGASAYIVKSKFDNMNLLQTIQRLI